MAATPPDADLPAAAGADGSAEAPLLDGAGEKELSPWRGSTGGNAKIRDMGRTIGDQKVEIPSLQQLRSEGGVLEPPNPLSRSAPSTMELARSLRPLHDTRPPPNPRMRSKQSLGGPASPTLSPHSRRGPTSSGGSISADSPLGERLSTSCPVTSSRSDLMEREQPPAAAATDTPLRAPPPFPRRKGHAPFNPQQGKGVTEKPVLDVEAAAARLHALGPLAEEPREAVAATTPDDATGPF